MTCEYCRKTAPDNVKALKESWICPVCVEKPFDNYIPLKVEIEDKYRGCIQVSKTVRLVYISDLSNNLDKIRNHWREHMSHDKPCTITLLYPDAYGTLVGEYDGIYIDADILDREMLANAINIAPDGYVKYVEPTKQLVLK